MKKQLLTLLMLVSVILCKHQALHSQVSNDEIYLEYGITTWSAIVFENDDPTEPVDSEPVIISNLITSGDLEWYFICNPMESGVGGGLEEPGFNSEYEIGPVPFGTAANFFLFAWERDTGVNSDLCYYEEEFDDNYGSDYPLHITPNTTITNNRAPGEWHDSFVEEGENVLLLEGGLGVYGVKPCIYWSYAHGNNINDPLQFGTLSNSDEVTHQNFTSAAPSGTIGAHDDYTNTGGEYDSRDVFYSFSLSEDAVVIISTQNSDFDTYIELYDSNNDIIQVNDDVQQGITTS
ncbi:MAG: hypothetical protein ACPGWM_10280, partial [Flavobacteriales bacterium]